MPSQSALEGKFEFNNTTLEPPKKTISHEKSEKRDHGDTMVLIDCILSHQHNTSSVNACI